MRLITTSMILSSLIAVGAAGCATDKPEATDDFSALDGVDQKTDAFSTHMKLIGSLDYGQTSDAVAYSKTPRYRAFKFGGNPGDTVDIWVRSEDGDALAWVLDNHWHILGKNDDADETTLDAHIKVTLGKSDSITHYVVFRDYGWQKAHFTVSIEGGNAMLACNKDADCVSIPQPMCCPNGKHVAVNKDHVDEYVDANACAQPPQICPLYLVNEDRVAECDVDVHQCVMVEPADIRCGGFTMNPHQCPSGFACHYDHVPDVPGTCQPTN